jgi:ketosteroid isomerase-like protein
MKTRLLGALVALTIGFAVPSIAQEQNTVDPEVRQQIEAVLMKFDDAYNKHDAAATAALYTQDAVRVLSWESEGGLASGRQAIEKKFAVDFASSPGNASHKLLQVYAVGNEMSVISEWSAGAFKGYKAFIYVRDADTWKIRLEYAILASEHR